MNRSLLLLLVTHMDCAKIISIYLFTAKMRHSIFTLLGDIARVNPALVGHTKSR